MGYSATRILIARLAWHRCIGLGTLSNIFVVASQTRVSPQWYLAGWTICYASSFRSFESQTVKNRLLNQFRQHHKACSEAYGMFLACAMQFAK